MNHQDFLPWIHLAFGVTAFLLLAWNRRNTSEPLTLQASEFSKGMAATPVFIWDDWHLEEDDRIVLHFRVEGSLVWWLTVDGECASLTEPTIIPKNFVPGQTGRIEMRYVGLLDSNEDEPLEFGIRYCTTNATIETQRFVWMLWRDPAPVAVGTLAALL